METVTIWYLIVALWQFNGVDKVISTGRYYTEAECKHYAALDLKAKSQGTAAVQVYCVPSPPRPKGLPEVQPHVPGKIEA